MSSPKRPYGSYQIWSCRDISSFENGAYPPICGEYFNLAQNCGFLDISRRKLRVAPKLSQNMLNSGADAKKCRIKIKHYGHAVLTCLRCDMFRDFDQRMFFHDKSLYHLLAKCSLQQIFAKRQTREQINLSYELTFFLNLIANAPNLYIHW